MVLQYRSGEEVRASDRILYCSEPGEVEFVTAAEDPATQWYIEEFGGGCMLRVAAFGRVFLTSSESDEDLEFVSRIGYR